PYEIDRGDYYVVGGRPVPLRQATDQVVIEFRAGAAADSVLAGLTGPPGPLPGFRTDATLGKNTFSLISSSRPGGDLDNTPAALAARPDINWAAPVFINGESGFRQWVTDEVVVDLPGGTDPARFFGGASYARLLGTPDQYVVTLAGRGGRAALAQANL